jgi:hypothetical protein
METNRLYILSMIKDEQRYIDEWINHYLNLGVDKIILIEDYCSKPHDISKYDKDKIILHNLNDCMNEEEKEFLKSHEFRMHIAYNIFYRMYNNECDWCFYVDIDEYLEYNDNIKTLLDNNFHQISFKWKTMTCSGHIRDPYPNEIYSLNDTYKDYNFSVQQVKSIFNLKSDYSHWNDFKHGANLPHSWFEDPYNNSNVKLIEGIYIKHFLTKSLDEWIYRLTQRGELGNDWFNRKFEDFFYINDITEPLKTHLNNKIKNKQISVKTNEYNKNH